MVSLRRLPSHPLLHTTISRATSILSIQVSINDAFDLLFNHARFFPRRHPAFHRRWRDSAPGRPRGQSRQPVVIDGYIRLYLLHPVRESRVLPTGQG